MSHMMQLDTTKSGLVAGHYDAKSLGAPFKVYLANGVTTTVEPNSGKMVTEIVDLPGLITAVVRSRILHSRKLSGDDLKFIRSALCLKAKDLAAALSLTPEHYSRCESGQKTMAVTTEKVYRGYVFLTSFSKDISVRESIQKHEGIAKDFFKEDVIRALSGIQKLFIEMKIEPVFDAEKELSFTFSRQCMDKEKPCGDEYEKWKDDLEKVAA